MKNFLFGLLGASGPVDFAHAFVWALVGIAISLLLGVAKRDPANDPRNFYSAKSGTSFDAPQVAGAYALLQGRFPTLPSWCWTWMLTKDARTFESLGITVTVPRIPDL